jgi:Uma2 family endonuclease
MNSPPTIPVLFTIDDVNRMAEAGIFVGRTDRIELIEGVLSVMSPATEEHDDMIRFLTTWSHRVVGDRYHLAIQQGIRLQKTESMPEPDIFWVHASHGRGRPTPAVVPLIIEVAVSSQEQDLMVKQRLYAMEQIAEYWVVLPQSATIVVHRQPLGERYTKVETLGLGQTVSPACISNATLDLEWLFRG